tara:strand:- start:53 stop:478 length:426 start_codon:yes stop_codon:yes gene_type:complete
MRKYFYFRTEADEDADDDKAVSAMIPVDRFRGAIPTNSGSAGTAADEITLFFESALNLAIAPSVSSEIIIQDSVLLNVTAGKAKDVCIAIAEAANGHPHSDGVVVIGDDATTDYDGSTKAAVYVHSGITSVGAITQAAALS